MKTSRPVIGVTGPDRGGLAAWWFTRLAVHRAGGRAVRITPARAGSAAGWDGLVLGGGADVDPGLYGQHRTGFWQAMRQAEPRRRARLAGLLIYPFLGLVRRLLGTKRGVGNRARDDLEKRLLDMARANGTPVLGICRGMQLINVHAGGTLHQDLQGFYREQPNVRGLLPRKAVTLAGGSRLARITGEATLRVNALHDQAVDRIGAGLRACARETSGLIQAVEGEGGFLLGVQWHPEYLPHKPRHQALFRALVAAAHQSSGP